MVALSLAFAPGVAACIHHRTEHPGGEKARGLEGRSCERLQALSGCMGNAWMKRHNIFCKMLVKEARGTDWVVLVEHHLREKTNKLFKPDLIVLNGSRAKGVDRTCHL